MTAVPAFAVCNMGIPLCFWPIVGLEPTLFPKATASTHSAAWATPADYKNGMVRSTHPTLAAQLASLMPGKVNKV